MLLTSEFGLDLQSPIVQIGDTNIHKRRHQRLFQNLTNRCKTSKGIVNSNGTNHAPVT